MKKYILIFVLFVLVINNSNGQEIWAWGGNGGGQLGDGTNSRKNVPTRIGTSIDWQKIFAGGGHTIGIKTDGSLWAWGYNEYGQLGDGTNTDKNVPTRIGTGNDWQNISAGYSHTFGIKTDGSLWAWGYNHAGQLGDGTNTDKNRPTRIGTSNDWQKISPVDSHTFGIKTDGSLWAWGQNDNGQLGDGTNTDKNRPTRIGTSNDWQDILPGYFYTFGIKTDGSLWAWGENYYGQLGDGTNKDKYVPTRIGISNDWQKISTSPFSVLGIKADGSLWAWGENENGQLGDGTTITKYLPTRIGTSNDWQKIFSRRGFTIGIKQDGSLWAWGYNKYGQLGDGTNTDKNVPTRIGADNTWKFIFRQDLVLNSYFVSSILGIKTDGSLWAWGENENGQLGDGTTITKYLPTRIGTSNNWQEISAGESHSIALITVSNPVQIKANFSSDKTSGETPLVVKFIDMSSGNPTTWSWDFGDGTKSYDQSPEHLYNLAGTYTVSLTVSDGKKIDSKTNTNYITVTNPVALTANFTSNIITGNYPLSVSFIDKSLGKPTIWSWDFGDGQKSDKQNPIVVYNQIGVYTVSLTVSDGKSLNNTTKKDYIVVSGWDAPNLSMNDIGGITGEKVKIPIYFYNTNSISNETTGFTAKLKYNATLLFPTGGTPLGSVNSKLERTLDLLLPSKPDNNGLLTTLEFMAMLGNETYTDIELYDITSIGKPVVVNKRVKSKFSLLNVSNEGGLRLINSKNNFSYIKSIEPNPAIDNTKVSLTSEGENHVTLELYNIFGEKLKIIYEGNLTSGVREFNINLIDLNSGTYHIVIKSENEIKSELLNIIK